MFWRVVPALLWLGRGDFRFFYGLRFLIIFLLNCAVCGFFHGRFWANFGVFLSNAHVFVFLCVFRLKRGVFIILDRISGLAGLGKGIKANGRQEGSSEKRVVF